MASSRPLCVRGGARLHHVRKDGPRARLELVRARVVHAHAQHVRGQQVTGELDAAELQPQRGREGAGQGGLAGAGDVLEEQVPARQQRRQRQAHRFALAAEHGLHLGDQVVHDVKVDLGYGRGYGVQHGRVVLGGDGAGWMVEATLYTECAGTVVCGDREGRIGDDQGWELIATTR
jgi:hypothetical protein